MKNKKEVKDENIKSLLQAEVEIKGKLYILLIAPVPVKYTKDGNPIYGVIAYNKEENKGSKEVYFNGNSFLLHPIKVRKQIIRELNKVL